MVELIKVNDRIWYSMYEEERDRPCLGYVRGDHWSLAVDAGHSDAHVEEFYEALRKENLPLPSLTVITHWHWDHAFGMHKICGLSVANAITNRHLKEFADEILAEGTNKFLSLDPSIQKEYAGGRKVVIVPADIEYNGGMVLNLGGVSARLFQSISPHTDDTTLVYLPEERFLFIGDSISGVFPTWVRNPEKTRELMRTIEETDADICLGGHWPIMTKRELLNALAEDTV